ncbi:glycosyltransferase [Deinococcus hohokamensis]|uniref:Glycosyltransferase n=1 Tax=Deinococcus hohokamensis TaxID=309883 RepID=A0ABV9I7T4_9DEIO
MRKFLTLLDVIGLASFGLYAAQQLASAVITARRIPTAEAGSGAHLTFLVPALNEEQVIEPTLRNLRQMAPEARVVVIDDASDDQTAQIALRLAAEDPGVQLLRRTLPEARQNKGKAMTWAVRQLLQGPLSGRDLTQEVLVGIDADGRIGPDFAPQVRGAFLDPQVMAAQGWMRYRQTTTPLPGAHGFVARILLVQQDLENFILGHYQRVRHWAGTASLTGNGQCMRASYVAHQLERGVLPWPDVLLEDFGSALEIRLDDPRWRIAMLTAHVGQQGMIDAVPFMRQRARWIQGTMECLPYLPRLLRSGTHPVTLVDFTYLILGPWLNAALLLSMGTQPLRRAMKVQGLVTPGWVGLAFTLLPLGFQLNWAVRYCREQRLPWTSVVYIMATLPIFSAITLWSLPLAFYRHFTGRNTWYKSVRHAEPLNAGPGTFGAAPLGAGD